MNPIKKALITCFLIVPLQVIYAATTPDSIWVTGEVTDAVTQKPIEDADVIFMRTDSSVVSREKTVDWCKKYGINDGTVLITYNIPVPEAGKYILHVAAKGYEDDYVNVEIPEKRYGKRVEEWDMAPVPLFKKSKQLDELVVKASKIMMVNKGDTVVYNASAFQLAEGSMLDGLISLLPGVRLTKDGQIFVNEQYVSSLLINGKDFFDGNPQVALKNLPAYTVDKVKAYRRGQKSDYLIKRDSTERLQDDLVLDVQLKHEFDGTLLANAEAGYGTDSRYLGRVFGLRMDRHSRFTAFGSLNNVGITDQPTDRMSSALEDLQTSPATDRSAGLDWLIEKGKDQLAYHTSLTVTDRRQHTTEETSTANILPDWQEYVRSRARGYGKRTEVSWRNLLSVPTRRVYMEFTFGGEYGKDRDEERLESSQFDRLPMESYRLAALDSVLNTDYRGQLLQSLINRYIRQSHSSAERYAAAASAQAKWKSPLTGSPVSLYTEFSYQRQRAKDNLMFDMRSYPVSSTLQRTQNNRNRLEEYAGKVRLDYEYALTKALKMIGSYEFDAAHTLSRRAIDTLNAVTDVEVARLLVRDAADSYNRHQNAFTHKPELQLRWASPRWLVSLHLPLVFERVRMTERRESMLSASPRKNNFAFEPQLLVNGAQGLSFSYAYTEQLPDMVYLTGFSDKSDPMTTLLGNTQLKTTGKHLLQAGFAKSDASKVMNLGVNAMFSVTHDDIAMQHLLDLMTGVSTYSPTNVNGNYHFLLNGSFSQGIGKSRHWRPEVSFHLDLTRSVGYSSDGATAEAARQSMRSLSLNGQVGAAYQRESVGLRFFIQPEWFHAISTRQFVDNASIRRVRYAASAELPLPWSISLSTDLSLFTMHGYEADALNGNTFVMNMALSRAFLRDKSLVVQLTGFDMFKGLDNITQTINANGRVETWRNSMSRYLMLKLIYRFNKKNKRQE